MSVTNFANPEALQCKLRAARYGSDLFKKGTRCSLAPHNNPDSNFDHRDQHAFIPRIPVGPNICARSLVDALAPQGVSLNEKQASLWLYMYNGCDWFRPGLRNWY